MSDIFTPGTGEIINGIYIIENVQTNRYVFQDGEPIKGKRGDEKGWKDSSGIQAPKVVGADANYHNRASWKITYIRSGKHIIENVVTRRLLFQDGKPLEGKRGDEGDWLANSGPQAPQVVGADENYSNRAEWYIRRQSNDACFIVNVETGRYLFQEGAPIKGKRGDEKGWKADSGFESPNIVGADENYNSLAYFKFIESVGTDSPSEKKVTSSQNKEEEEKMKGIEKNKREEEEKMKGIEKSKEEEEKEMKGIEKSKEEEKKEMKGVEEEEEKEMKGIENMKEEKKTMKRRKTDKKEEEEKMTTRQKDTKKEEETIKKWAPEMTEQIFGCCNVTCLKYFIVLIVTLFILYLLFYFIRG